jgi:hypothetical protein
MPGNWPFPRTATALIQLAVASLLLLLLWAQRSHIEDLQKDNDELHKANASIAASQLSDEVGRCSPEGAMWETDVGEYVWRQICVGGRVHSTWLSQEFYEESKKRGKGK